MSSTLHEKYWFYRDRMKYFVKPGKNIGESIIVDGRNRERTGHLSVGDQTIDLGFYLAILSMEFNQLGSQSLERNQTLTELYYALKAFRRLDSCEAYAPWYKSEPKQDGFFMRYDIQLKTGDSEFDYDYFNHGLNETQQVLTRPPDMPAYVNITNAGENNWWEQERTAMSMDQAVYMIMGLGFVTKCLPNAPIGFKNTMNGNTEPPFNFYQYAKLAINDIADYISNVYLLEGQTFDFEDMEDGENWQYAYDIIRPGSIMFSEVDMLGYWTIFDPNKELVQRGAWPFLIRWGFGQAIYKLTHKIIQTGFPSLYLYPLYQPHLA